MVRSAYRIPIVDRWVGENVLKFQASPIKFDLEKEICVTPSPLVGGPHGIGIILEIRDQ